MSALPFDCGDFALTPWVFADQREEEPDLEVDSFRGLDFDGWLRLIIKVSSDAVTRGRSLADPFHLQYAFFLTKNDEAEAGQETLIHVQSASVFKQSEQRTLALHLARAGSSLLSPPCDHADARFIQPATSTSTTPSRSSASHA